MTDELDDLKAAMKAATPSADPARRAANLAAAQEIFTRSQGSAAEPRPTVERGLLARLIKGAKQMQSTISRTGALAATTAVAAVAIFLVVPQGRNILIPPAEFEQLEKDAVMEKPMVEAPLRGLRLDRTQSAQEKRSEAPPAPPPHPDQDAKNDAEPQDLAESAQSDTTAMPRTKAAEGVLAPTERFVAPVRDT